MPSPLDCLQCGTCCYSDTPAYVRVTGDDWSRLGDLAADVAHFIGHRAYMKMADGHCGALQPDPASGRFVCTLYDRRPQVCRDLARGSPACDAELARKGDRLRRILQPPQSAART